MVLNLQDVPMEQSPTEKMINFARKIASCLRVALPTEETFNNYADFIDQHKEQYIEYRHGRLKSYKTWEEPWYWNHND